MVKPREPRPRPEPLTPEEAAALDAVYDDLQARLDRYWARTHGGDGDGDGEGDGVDRGEA